MTAQDSVRRCPSCQHRMKPYLGPQCQLVEGHVDERRLDGRVPAALSGHLVQMAGTHVHSQGLHTLRLLELCISLQIRSVADVYFCVQQSSPQLSKVHVRGTATEIATVDVVRHRSLKSHPF